ncbi:hypothetical protein D4Z93_07825 [Clostridium fermenticellae]|uniref:Transmembrane protein n=1 Tax=Clostridium fermenticellae TaxID=2068654 RepID=A0A386H445_9CLOT|nr:hypothetical protein [Clostridium fermenticellae]AYD40436.1 hypothetical protein D4Z93_07825 [Clostridium fermenticellae]
MKFKFIKKNINYGIVAAILLIVICFCTLFVRPVVGMADNGDFFRIISQSNIYYLQGKNAHSFVGYFDKDYGIYKYNNENPKMIVSTQPMIVKAAVLIDRIITRGYTFDIRFLAFLYILIYAFSFYLIVKVLTHDIKSDKLKLLFTVLFVFVFCDTGYIAYFNSFFGEAMNLTFFFLSIGILLYMCKFKEYSIFNLIMFFAASLIFVGSKQQLAPVGVLTAIVLFRLFMVNKKKIFRYMALTFIVIIVSSSLYFYKSISGDFDYINRYYAMNRGVLLYEWEPEGMLKQFNINPQYSMLEDTVGFNKIPVIDTNSDKLKTEFYSKYSIFSIIVFYLKNPRVLSKMINFGIMNGYSIRPRVLGNYEKKEGKAYGAQSHFFSLWSTIKEKYIPHNALLTLVIFGAYFYFAVKRYISARKKEDIDSQLFEETFLYVFLVGASQILICVTGAGDGDLAKHVFMFNVSFDLILLYSASLIIRNIYEKKHYVWGKEYKNED